MNQEWPTLRRKSRLEPAFSCAQNGAGRLFTAVHKDPHPGPSPACPADRLGEG